MGRLEGGLFAQQEMPHALPVAHAYKQMQLQLYFLLHYIRKASKALGQKSLQTLQERLDTCLPQILAIIAQTL
jgi:hypothetical protein